MPDEQLQTMFAMFAGSVAQFAFFGHTHVHATQLAGAAAGSWGIAPRRVSYHIKATIADL